MMVFLDQDKKMGISFRTYWHGLRCLELVTGKEPSPTLFRSLACIARRLREAGIADGAASSYRSVAVYWDEIPERGIEEAVVGLAEDKTGCLVDTPVRVHEVAVRYNGEDLLRVAEEHGMTVEEVVQRHASGVYTVAAIGFLPHFGYLWGLDERLATPRLAVPRSRVPAGAVGIGGGQTGIYPRASPGGWNLLGRVEEDLCCEVCRQLRVGDEVSFEVLG